MTEGGAVDEYAVSFPCTQEEFLAAAKLYSRAIVDNYDLLVSVSDLEWVVSTRAKRRAGAVKHTDEEPVEVNFAWRFFKNRPWEEMASIIRHELIHVHLLNQYADPTHGRRFKALAEELDTDIHCSQFTEPEWIIRCTDCDAETGRYRKSKIVKHPDRYQCTECGGSLTVEENRGID